jgi:hypothetical protein
MHFPQLAAQFRIRHKIGVSGKTTFRYPDG